MNYKLIKNGELLYKFFGYAPSFGDGEIVYLGLDNEKNEIKMKIHSIYHKNMSSFITFAFKKPDSVELRDFRHQNVIEEIILTQSNNKIHVDIDACVGLSMSFDCQEIIIEKIETSRPNTFFKKLSKILGL